MSSAATAPAADAAMPNKLGLTLDEDTSGLPTGQNNTPCETPKGYRAIALDITPTTWKADMSKCNVCEDSFTWLNHRHKCRNCQEAVCNGCSKSRKVLRAHTAPKRVCNACVQKCWTPREAKDSAATTPVKAETAKCKDDRRVSLTVSTSDANACETDATATAPLSPGTPAEAGFFPGLITPWAPAGGGEGGCKKEDDRTSSSAADSSTGRRRHRRHDSVAMPPPSSLALPVSLSATPASAMPPPPTPAGDDNDGVEEENDALAGTPPSASVGRGGAGANPQQLGPFFGGRPRSRRESSGGRLEGSSRSVSGGRWGGVGGVGVAFGGGIFGNGYDIQDVDMDVEGEDGRQVEEIRAEQQQQQQACSSSSRPASLPVVPEELTTATTAGHTETMKQQQQQQQQQQQSEEEYDDGEGGPMMMKMSGWPGVVLGAVAIGSGVMIAVVVRSAFSLVFFY